MKLGNWVKQTTTTTGTGNLTLSSVSGYPTANDVFGLDVTFPYTIWDSTGAPIECGTGHLSTSSTLVRDFVRATYSGGTYTSTNSTTGQVNLAAGTYTIGCSIDDSSVYVEPARTFSRVHGTANARIHSPRNIMQRNSSALAWNNANRLYAFPIYIAERGPFDAFVVRCTTAAGLSDLALYEVGPDGLPGKLLVAAVGVAFSGAVNYATFAAQSIQPGWYYMAFNNTTASQGTYNAILEENMGHGGDLVNNNPFVYKAQTAGAIPDPYGTPGTIGNSISNGLVPLICLRCS